MKKISDKIIRANLKGMFMGIYLHDKTPVVFKLENILFLPVFSTPEKFWEAMGLANVAGEYKIQVINDHEEFLSQLKGKIRVMLDPWQTDKGTTRFTELTFESDN